MNRKEEHEVKKITLLLCSLRLCVVSLERRESFAEKGVEGKLEKFFTFFFSVFVENEKFILMINIYLILKTLYQYKLNVKNAYKLSKIFLQYNVLLFQN
jgi:hypothetical protein